MGVKRARPPWGPWYEDPEAGRALGDRVLVNAIYQVNVRVLDHAPAPFGQILHLSIKRRDKRPVPDVSRWRDFQLIKNELVGPEFEAVEIYPAESRLVDSANQFHLWVFGEGYKLPFGFADRFVTEEIDPVHGAVQQPFLDEHRPKDLDQHHATTEVAQRLSARLRNQRALDGAATIVRRNHVD